MTTVDAVSAVVTFSIISAVLGWCACWWHYRRAIGSRAERDAFAGSLTDRLTLGDWDTKRLVDAIRDPLWDGGFGDLVDDLGRTSPLFKARITVKAGEAEVEFNGPISHPRYPIKI